MIDHSPLSPSRPTAPPLTAPGEPTIASAIEEVMSRGLTLALHDSIRESRGGCERGSFRRRRLRWPAAAVFASMVLLSLFGPQGTLAEPGSKGIYGTEYKMTRSPISSEAIGTKSLAASWRSGERERGKALPRTQPELNLSRARPRPEKKTKKQTTSTRSSPAEGSTRPTTPLSSW